MADYIVGDVQGCVTSLKNLLTKINFSYDSDRLFFLGDLVNRGENNLETMKFILSHQDNFDLVLETNLKGPYFLTQKIARWMIEQKKDHPKDFFSIINISSVSATVASTQRGEYCISKAGIAMATKLWAARLGEFDIPVYEIQPGVIKTDMTAGVQAKYDALFDAGLTVQKRWGMPNDIGKVAVALALHSLPYATGQVIQVDGGLTLQRL